MEAIEKAKIAEFAAKVTEQATKNTNQINECQATALRLQGATAAIEYIMNIDPIEVGDEDEVTDQDVEDLVSYLETQPLDESAEYDVEVGDIGEFGADSIELSAAVEGAA